MNRGEVWLISENASHNNNPAQYSRYRAGFFRLC